MPELLRDCERARQLLRDAGRYGLAVEIHKRDPFNDTDFAWMLSECFRDMPGLDWLTARRFEVMRASVQRWAMGQSFPMRDLRPMVQDWLFNQMYDSIKPEDHYMARQVYQWVTHGPS